MVLVVLVVGGIYGIVNGGMLIVRYKSYVIVILVAIVILVFMFIVIVE